MEAQAAQKFDLLVKGGLVIDPANQLHQCLDIGVIGGKIACVAPNLPAENAEKVLDARDCLVTPGLIDMHTHLYPLLPRPVPYAETLPTVNPDAHLIKEGITTTCDAGTVGWRDFAYFKTRIIDESKVRVLSFLNIARRGMVEMISEQTVGEHDYRVAASLCETFPEDIVGLKAAHYRSAGHGPIDAAHPAYASVKNALKAAELYDVPIMVDFLPNGAEQTYRNMLKLLRPGDIHTHVFARQFPTVDENGKVYAHMWEARERGVKFDLGHGAASFTYRNGKRAYDDGFAVDTLSSDLHMRNVFGNVVSFLHIMGKMLAMGMPLDEVIRRATSEPAKLIRRTELGNLSVGSCADIAVLKKIEGDFHFPDCGRVTLPFPYKLECFATVRAGDILFDPYGLAMVAYENAPADYWKDRFQVFY